MAELVRPGVAWSVLEVVDRSEALHPQEAALVAGAAPRRVRSFSSGRAAARLALAAGGCADPGPILAQGRRPQAPPGWRLSITHSDDFAVAVAGEDAVFAGLGVDVERIDRMELGLARHIVRPTDRFPEGYGTREMTLAFSLREAMFKAIDPVAQKQLRRIDLAWDEQGPQARLEPAVAPTPVFRHAEAAGHVLTLALQEAGA